MKGVMFNLLEEVLSADDPWAWDELVDAVDAGGADTAVDTYADAESLRLVGALPAAVTCPAGHGVGPDDTTVTAEHTRWYGRRAMPLLAERYADFFAPHDDPRDFLATVEVVIHTEVRKLDRTAEVPTPGVADHTDEHGARTLTLTYRSERRLCHLAEGFVLGAGDHDGRPPAVSQTRCMLDGADSCVLVVTAA